MLERIFKQSKTNGVSSRTPAQLGFMLALLATLFYSLKPIIIKLIYQYDISSANILAWRVIISLPVYFAVGIWIWMAAHKDKKNSEQQEDQYEVSAKGWIVKTVILGAIGFYLAALLDLIGLQYISSQLARLILFTYPTLVAILGWIIFRHKVSRTVIIALVFSYIGVGFIFAYDFGQLGSQVTYGSFLMFLSVLAFSLYVLLSKSVIDQVGGSAFTVVAMLSSGVCILVHFVVTEQSFTGLAISTPAFVLIAIMTILTTVIPSFLIAEAIGLIGPQKTAIAGTLGPAATSVFAVLLLNEAFGVSQITGIVLVVAAITYMQSEQNSDQQEEVDVDY
jgi:drug/metabolite transporter (DMT)-like permease